MRKIVKIDGWDFLLTITIVVMTYIVYIIPTLDIENLSLFAQFAVTITDKTYSFLIVALIFKKLVEKSNGK